MLKTIIKLFNSIADEDRQQALKFKEAARRHDLWECYDQEFTRALNAHDTQSLERILSAGYSVKIRDADQFFTLAFSLSKKTLGNYAVEHFCLQDLFYKSLNSLKNNSSKRNYNNPTLYKILEYPQFLEQIKSVGDLEYLHKNIPLSPDARKNVLHRIDLLSAIKERDTLGAQLTAKPRPRPHKL